MRLISEKQRVRSYMGLDIVRQDIRYALQSARRRPGFSLAVIGILALGIGAATAMFSIVSGVLIRPLPFSRPERLVQVVQLDAQHTAGAVFYADLEAARNEKAIFEEAVAYGFRSKNLSADDPERIPVVWAE